MAEVPADVTTRTSTVPAECLGAVTSTLVLETTLTEVPFVAANFTADTCPKPLPAIVSRVPPAVPPADGDTLITLGLTVVAVAGCTQRHPETNAMPTPAMDTATTAERLPPTPTIQAPVAVYAQIPSPRSRVPAVPDRPAAYMHNPSRKLAFDWGVLKILD